MGKLSLKIKLLLVSSLNQVVGGTQPATAPEFDGWAVSLLNYQTPY